MLKIRENSEFLIPNFHDFLTIQNESCFFIFILLFGKIRKTIISYGPYGEQLKFYNTFLLAFVKILVHATFSVKRKNFCGSNKKIELNYRENGHGVYQFSNGDQYVGSFENGRLHGNGTYTWASGR